MILMTKLKNALQLKNKYLECHLKNISINGDKRGCTGFIHNPKTGKIVYVNTEKSCYGPLEKYVLWRYAENLKDFTGKQNQFCYENDLVSAVVNALAGQ